MRVIATKTLAAYWKVYPPAKQPLLCWYDEAGKAGWNNPDELREQFRYASILNSKRVVFNIHGNRYRLIVDIEYRLKLIFVAWFGTHAQYDKIDALKISYVKTDKN